DFPTHRGIEATPIVVDGVMYVTGSWSMVYAFDAKTGAARWQYDPEVPRDWAVHLCCDVVNRGVALWDDKVFVGTLDGRLIALNRADGSVHWSVQTTDKERPYSITGAPRIINGKVMIGNGGAELGVRGYVSAYDANSGEMAWRFYTVPGDPSQPFESPAMERAAKTWKGGEWWKIGGGGTVWDSMAYDPELNLLYIGVGNGSPWNREIRSPGGGDNLYLSSIVALNPDTGAYAWHYQTTPGESWDYTAAQHMILADIEIDGRTRNVIMQAPKNGFFYVLDRATGELISAEKYTKVTWATQVDKVTGRPVLSENARYLEKPELAFPHPYGGHSWHPMSFSPLTGLVYIPAQEIPFIYAQDKGFVYTPGYWNVGVDFVVPIMPDDPEEKKALMAMIKGYISAWDPVQQKEVWRVKHANAWNGGILSTAGNVLFQGNSAGKLVAYRADNGEPLWSMDAQTGIGAAPVTYAVDGEQYVAVAVGWGGAYALAGGIAAGQSKVRNVSRLLVFKLDGKAQLPPLPPPAEQPTPPPLTADAETIAHGKKLFASRCGICHGDAAGGGGVLPDLRYMSAETHSMFQAIVRGGLRHKQGMVGFGDILEEKDVDALHAYVIERAHVLAKGG
ncbi:MAG: PQQ-dependent dehydrogenase, methanol/ethanol family, partial [Pseudomonadales bacterium]